MGGRGARSPRSPWPGSCCSWRPWRTAPSFSSGRPPPFSWLPPPPAGPSPPVETPPPAPARPQGCPVPFGACRALAPSGGSTSWLGLPSRRGSEGLGPRACGPGDWPRSREGQEREAWAPGVSGAQGGGVGAGLTASLFWRSRSFSARILCCSALSARRFSCGEGGKRVSLALPSLAAPTSAQQRPLTQD